MKPYAWCLDWSTRRWSIDRASGEGAELLYLS
jgi:hypothetical protein